MFEILNHLHYNYKQRPFLEKNLIGRIICFKKYKLECMYNKGCMMYQAILMKHSIIGN